MGNSMRRSRADQPDRVASVIIAVSAVLLVALLAELVYLLNKILTW